MEDRVTAAEANREFSSLLRGVREGRSFTITNHGKAVARIVPVETNNRDEARASLFERLRNQPVLEAGRPTRDEAYDD